MEAELKSKLQLTAASNDETAAQSFCSLLATPIRTELMKSLRVGIIDDMKSWSSCMTNNQNFKIKILKDLAMQKSFTQYTLFLTNISASFRNWVKVYVEQYCNMVVGGETKLVKLAERLLARIIQGITATARQLESKYGGSVDVHLQLWLNDFHAKIKNELQVDFETFKKNDRS